MDFFLCDSAWVKNLNEREKEKSLPSPDNFWCGKSIGTAGHIDILIFAYGHRRRSALNIQYIGRNYRTEESKKSISFIHANGIVEMMTIILFWPNDLYYTKRKEKDKTQPFGISVKDKVSRIENEGALKHIEPSQMDWKYGWILYLTKSAKIE